MWSLNWNNTVRSSTYPWTDKWDCHDPTYTISRETGHRRCIVCLDQSSLKSSSYKHEFVITYNRLRKNSWRCNAVVALQEIARVTTAVLKVKPVLRPWVYMIATVLDVRKMFRSLFYSAWLYLIKYNWSHDARTHSVCHFVREFSFFVR